MAYGHAVLGESLELCREAAEWGLAEQKRLEKNEAAKQRILLAVENIKTIRKNGDNHVDDNM